MFTKWRRSDVSDVIMLSVTDLDLTLEVLRRMVETVKPCQNVAVAFVIPDARNSIGDVEPGIMHGDLLGADQNHLPMGLSEYFRPGIVDTLRAEYFARFSNKMINRQQKVSLGTRRFVESVMKTDSALDLGVFPVGHQAIKLHVRRLHPIRSAV